MEASFREASAMNMRKYTTLQNEAGHLMMVADVVQNRGLQQQF